MLTRLCVCLLFAAGACKAADAAEPVVSGAVPVAAAGTAPTPVSQSLLRPKVASEAAPSLAAEAQRFPGAASSHAALQVQLQRGKLRTLQSVGTTSLTLRARLQGPVDGALKLVAKPRPLGPAAELAAYKLGQLLHIDNIPPVVRYQLSRAQLRAALLTDPQTEWEVVRHQVHWRGDKVAQGVLIYWVPELETLPLARSRQRRRWEAWLQQQQLLPSQWQTRARDLSTMVLFDYLIGNWDRFSGGNTQVEGRRGRLVLRDHDVAFATPMPARLHARILGQLLRCERFSRALIKTLLALDAARLRAEFGGRRQRDASAESKATPEATREQAWLKPAQIDALIERRATALSHIGALIDVHGVDQVLVFP